MVPAFFGTAFLLGTVISRVAMAGKVRVRFRELIRLQLLEQRPVSHVVMAERCALGGTDGRGTLQRHRERRREDEEQPCDPSRHAEILAQRMTCSLPCQKSRGKSIAMARFLLLAQVPQMHGAPRSELL